MQNQNGATQGSRKGSSQKKLTRSFDPRPIAIAMAEALNSDLLGASHVLAPKEVVSVYQAAQRDKFLSKFTSTTDVKSLESLAFEKFLKVNDHISKVNEHFRSFPDDPVALGPKSHDVDIVLRRARALLHYVMTPVSEDEWFLACKSSQGASVGVPYQDTSPEAKYSYPISVAEERLAPLWKRYKLYDKSFSEALDQLNSSKVLCEELEVVGASRATTVEKNDTQRRMIAVEPVVNMFFQQGLMVCLTNRLSAIGLDLTNVARKHTSLAWESSITSEKDTIDFSSASDCVAIELLRWLIPSHWYLRLALVRTPSMNIGGKVHKLEMMSTMGNATTFPIETLVFWSIAVSAAMTVDKPKSRSLLPVWKYFKTCSVFGDDCITPRASTDLFMRSAEAVGFLINKEKSFFDGGYFRESCGGDYYRGYDVRPVYLRDPASTARSSLEPWLYTTWNKVIKKYISYFGPLTYVYDKEFFRVMFSVFKKERLLVRVVPTWFPDDAGLKIGEDFFRFSQAYDFRVHPVSRDQHGTYRFSYLRYRYRTKKSWHEQLRLAIKMKQLVHDDKHDVLDPRTDVVLNGDNFVPDHMRNIRRNGGYVVASAKLGHWSPVFGSSQTGRKAA